MNKLCKKTNEQGSVSVFFAVMLFPMLLFFLACFSFVVLLSIRSNLSSANILMSNGAEANYNHAIYENYGLVTYTKTAAEMTAYATTYFEESCDVDASIDMTFSEPLSSDSVLTGHIVQYMSTRDYLTADLKPEDMGTFSGLSARATPVLEQYNTDMELARTEPEEPEEPEEPQESNAYLGPDATEEDAQAAVAAAAAYEEAVLRNEQRKSDAYFLGSFLGSSTNRLPEEHPYTIDCKPIADSNLDDMEVLARACNAIGEVQKYYSNVDSVKNMITNKTNDYYVANYVTDMFSSYNYYGPSSLSGNYFESGDMQSVSPWGELEYILFGNNVDYTNWQNMYMLTGKTFFVMHLINRDYTMDDAEIRREAELLADGNDNLIPMYEDEIRICIAASQAHRDMVEIYSNEISPELNWIYVSDGEQGLYMNYMYFCELYAYLETNRNMPVVLNRIRNVIDANAQNSCEEAREFHSDCAYTRVDVSWEACIY